MHVNILQNKRCFVSYTINQEPRWEQVCKKCFSAAVCFPNWRYSIKLIVIKLLRWNTIERLVLKYLSCNNMLSLLQLDSDVCTYFITIIWKVTELHNWFNEWCLKNMSCDILPSHLTDCTAELEKVHKGQQANPWYGKTSIWRRCKQKRNLQQEPSMKDIQQIFIILIGLKHDHW